MSKEQEKAMNQQLAGVLMSLVVIFVLFIPAYAFYQAEVRTETHILTVQGLYTNGTDILCYEPIDKTHVQSLYIGETIDGSQPNNDSFYYRSQGSVKWMWFTNFWTYLGDGNYSVTPNYSLETTPRDYRGIGIPLNVTPTQFLQYDFVRLTSNDEHTAKYLLAHSTVSGGSRRTAWQQINDTSYIIPITLGLEGVINDYPDEKMYIEWDGQTTDALDDTDANWIFKIEGFNLDPADQLFWSDTHLVYGAVAISVVVLSVCALFTTNFIDVKTDRGKPGGKR